MPENSGDAGKQKAPEHAAPQKQKAEIIDLPPRKVIKRSGDDLRKIEKRQGDKGKDRS